MTISQEPAVQLRRLRIALREERQRLGHSQKQVADALDWSTSKLLRIENGTVTISRSDLLALLRHYGVNDQKRIDELVTMAQIAKRQSWSQYREVLDQDFLIFLGFESAASLIRSFQPLAIPGLLQTEEYANTSIRAFADPDTPESAIEQMIEARMERKDLFTRSDPPEMFFILDEAVVRRRVGPGNVMIRQLEHLKELAQVPTVSIQILPFSVGVRPGIREPFVLLDFPDPADDDLLYIERGKFLSRDNPAEVERYLKIFFDLEDVATPRGRIAEVIDRIISQLKDPGDSSIPSEVA